MEFDALRQAVQQALRYWARDSRAGNPLEPLRLFHHYKRDATSIRNASNKLLQDALAELKKLHPQEATLLHERFMVGVSVVDAARQRNVAASTLYNWQRSALTHLAEIIAGREARLRTTPPRLSLYPMRAIASDYLVGLEERAAPLMDLLRRPGAPWLICLSGMGGVGKTTLANYVARRLVERGEFVEVGWASAQCQRMAPDGTLHDMPKPSRTVEDALDTLATQLIGDGGLETEARCDQRTQALLRRLKEAPHLIVVDRVDLVDDSDRALSLLQEMARPSKFLVTVRRRPDDAHFLYRYDVPKLNRSHALALLRSEAERLGFDSLATAPDSALDEVYAMVGGNPLALRVMVDEVENFGLNGALDNLKHARGQTVERLYEYLYCQAWTQLDGLARRVLLTMSAAGLQGDHLQAIAEAVDAPRPAVQDALATLIGLNLVDSEGDLNERRYTIRRLTGSFVTEQAHHW